jgi:hypothetical protein
MGISARCLEILLIALPLRSDNTGELKVPPTCASPARYSISLNVVLRTGTPL